MLPTKHSVVNSYNGQSPNFPAEGLGLFGRGLLQARRRELNCAADEFLEGVSRNFGVRTLAIDPHSQLGKLRFYH